uniref:Bm357 n=1 Tax=Brugia malayi TaxID=6279 RepID=A0A0H5S594_BRUMA|nr:Bm357 [Brugia malayi]
MLLQIDYYFNGILQNSSSDEHPMMSRTVVFIVCVTTIFISTRCEESDISCGSDFYKKRIGDDFYCYLVHKISRSNTSINEHWRTIATSDQDVCRQLSDYPIMDSVSIRNNDEFELVKFLYRTFERHKWLIHADRNDFPLLIGLTFINRDYHWFDNSPFDYDEFLRVGQLSNFSSFREKDCRRFFLYAPPTQYIRPFYSFDMDCYSQFPAYYIICRYKLDTTKTPEGGPIRKIKDFDYDYPAAGRKGKLTEVKATASKLFRKAFIIPFNIEIRFYRLVLSNVAVIIKLVKWN